MRLAWIAGAIAVAAVSVLLTAATASAHARLKESTPGRGEVLATAPAAVTITYTNDIQKISGTYDLAVTDANSGDVTSGPTVLNDEDRSQVSVPLNPDLPAGRYVVRFENISDEDGDPFEGAFSFYIGREPTADERAADDELALIGEEETPAASPTAAATRPPSTPDATATADVPDGEDDGGGGGNARLWIIVAAALVAGGVTAFVAWQTLVKKG